MIIGKNRSSPDRDTLQVWAIQLTDFKAHICRKKDPVKGFKHIIRVYKLCTTAILVPEAAKGMLQQYMPQMIKRQHIILQTSLSIPFCIYVNSLIWLILVIISVANRTDNFIGACNDTSSVRE